MSADGCKDLLLCPGCARNFDDGKRAPIILPCLHTSCSTCLTSSVTDGSIQCTNCNETHEVAKNGIKSFPVNSARKHVIKTYILQTKADQLHCQECVDKSEQGSVVGRCQECEEFLCEVCIDAHKRTKLTRHHRVTTIDDVPNSLPRYLLHTQTCQVIGHKDKPLEYYCKSKNCNKAVCGLCVIKDHKQSSHSVKNIDDVYDTSKKDIEENLRRIVDGNKTPKVLRVHIEEAKENLKLMEESASHDLETYFETLAQILQRRKEDLRRKLSIEYENKMQLLDEQLLYSDNQREKFEQLQRSFEEVSNYSSPAEFLLMEQLILSRIKTLENSKDNTPSTVLTDIRFKPSKEEEVELLLKNSGDIICSNICVPNTEVRTNDIRVGNKQTPLMIFLKDSKSRPLTEKGLDIKVEIVDNNDKRTLARVIDCLDREGCYKVEFRALTTGKYKGFVNVQGTELAKHGYIFKAKEKTGTEKLQLETKGLGTTTVHCTGREHQGNIQCPEIKMNIQNLHHQNYISDDGRTMTNQKGRRKRLRHSSHAYLNFRGTTGTCPIGDNGRYYFEVIIQFFIKRSLRQDLIFEIGLCRKSDVDKYYTIDFHEFGYAFCARKCHICRTICLQAWNNKQKLTHIPIMDIAPPGSAHNGIYGFLFDANKKNLIVTDVKNRKVIVRFQDVDISKPLWPVFGLYNPDLVDSSITIKSGENISTNLHNL